MAVRLQALDYTFSLLVDKSILLIGRHAECDVQLESSKISRRHCFLALVNQRLFIRDLESTNGLRVNGEKVDESELRDGDELWIGNLRFRVAWEQSSIPVKSPAVVKPGQYVESKAQDQQIPPHLLSCEFPVPLHENSQLTAPTPSSQIRQKSRPTS